uniref:Putative secreted protein n=1 Tax=Xenopsylla cheopis TaxID=163159 RepID=A0A6M2DVS8_XENCH
MPFLDVTLLVLVEPSSSMGCEFSIAFKSVSVKSSSIHLILSVRIYLVIFHFRLRLCLQSKIELAQILCNVPQLEQSNIVSVFVDLVHH